MSFKWLSRALASFSLLLSGAVPPPPGYTVPGADTKQKILLADDFSEGFKHWKNARPTPFKIEAGAGINGTAGAILRRTDPKKHGLAVRYYKGFIPGKQYRAKIKFCVDKLEFARKKRSRYTFHTLYVTCFGPKKEYLAERYPSFTPDVKGKWTECVADFIVPKGTDKVEIALSFYTGNGDLTGTIRYDDFYLEMMGDPEPVIYPMEPKQLRLSADGNMKFRVCNRSLIPEKDLTLRIVTGKKDLQVPVKNSVAEVKGLILPPGQHKFDLQLLNTAGKSVLGSAEYTFIRLSGKEKPVPGTAVFGNDNVLRVDGKPFCSIMAAVSPRHLDKAAVARLRSAGFNTVMPYSSLSLDIMGRGGKPSLQKIRESLDYCHKNGLKVVFSLKEQIRRGKLTRFEYVRGAEEISVYAVEKLKDHPAILMWYLADENPLTEIPAIRSLRQRIALIDPNHPTSVCTNFYQNMIFFATAGDMQSPDSYPVYDDSTQSMTKMRPFFPKDLGHPVIMTVQAFNWKAYRLYDDKTYRFPTEEEMRSMTFLCMNEGTIGMSYYGYTACFRQQEKLFPGSSKWFWPIISKVVHLTAELGDFVLSPEPAPVVRVENKAKNFVEAKAYRKGKSVRILVTGDGPGKADALLHVPENLKLSSRFGRCVPAGKGVWHFTGNNICSDLLTAD